MTCFDFPPARILSHAIPAAVYFALTALGCGPISAWAWGTEGHSIVAEIAQHRLNPAAAGMVSELIGSGRSLASISSWADDERTSRPETSNWHFVDIPRSRVVYSEADDCKPEARGDCVVKALVRARDTLACGGTLPERRDALRFAVHFVGDIHQPLHAIDEARGGNDIHVGGRIEGPACTVECTLQPKTSNLHSVWDSTLIRATVWDWGAYVDRLEAGWLKTDDFQIRVKDESPGDWAEQTHALANLIWTDKLVPQDGTVDGKPTFRIDTDYYRTVLPVVDQQLALAGVRLAGFLNSVASGGCRAALGATPGAADSAAGLLPYSNVGDAKAQANAYHDTIGSDGLTLYRHDQAAVGKSASQWLLARLASAPANPAIVLDVDETSLDNWREMHANDLGFIPEGPCDLSRSGEACGVKAWDQSGQAPAIASTLELFNTAREHGVAVFFITGRRESERAATEANLRAAGYEGWTELVMKPDAPKQAARAANYKAPARASKVVSGYTILLNVGDQPSDLAGGYAEKSFLMPNPYYRIP